MKALPLLMEVPRLSVEYLRVVVEGWNNGEKVNPTAFVVQFAFTAPEAIPAENQWANGSWETSNETYMARGLFGPATTAPLTAGDWVAWCRVMSSPETPVRCLGIVRIT